MSRYVATYRDMSRHVATCRDMDVVSENVVSRRSTNVVTTWLPEQNVFSSKRGEGKKMSRHASDMTRHDTTCRKCRRSGVRGGARHSPLSRDVGGIHGHEETGTTTHRNHYKKNGIL